jgi:hypothetical protein
VAGKRRRWQCTVQVAEWECQRTSATSPRGRGWAGVHTGVLYGGHLSKRNSILLFFQALVWCHNHIRDERYLVGTTLDDYHRAEKRSGASAAGDTAPAAAAATGAESTPVAPAAAAATGAESTPVTPLAAAATTLDR